MSARWTIEELDRLAVERPCHGSPPLAYYSDVGARMPSIRGSVREWFRNALRDDSKKWFAAAILRLKSDSARALLTELVQAAMTEPDPSFCRAFVLPLKGQATWPEVATAMLDVADRGGPLERGGFARALYWLKAEFPVCDPLIATRLNSWMLEEFVRATDIYAQRSLIGKLSFDPKLTDTAIQALIPCAIAKARSHEDEYIRHRIEIQLGESHGPYKALTNL